MSSDSSHYEMLRLRLAVSNAIDTWAILEGELSDLLQAVINDDNGVVGTAIYYSSTNTETSLRIVDAAIKAAMLNLNYGRALTLCWEAIRKKISDKKGTRNSIAHWHTCKVSATIYLTERPSCGILSTIGGGDVRPDQSGIH